MGVITGPAVSLSLSLSSQATPPPPSPAFCPDRRGAAAIAYCTRVPPHPSLRHLFVYGVFGDGVILPVADNGLFLLLSLVASCASLLAVCVLFTSLFSRAINHPHPILPLASFVLTPLPLTSSHLPPYFSEDHSGSGLLFLLLASTRQIAWCQGCCFSRPRLSRRLRSVCLCLSALLSAVTQNTLRSNSALPVTSCCRSAAPLNFVRLCVYCVFSTVTFIFYIFMYIISANVPEAPARAHCQRGTSVYPFV